MSSALGRGRPIRFRPSRPTSTKPPECAGIYYIYDVEGNNVYTGQAVNLRRRVYQHKRNGKIPKGGYVDCFKAKEGITYDELDYTEREIINKYNPPLNQRGGGGGRKSSKLGRRAFTEVIVGSGMSPAQETEQKRNIFYRLLGYEKVDRSGEVHYTKEPKAVFFMIIELIVKILLIAITLLSGLGIYLKFSNGVVIHRYLLIGMVVIPIICFMLFHYIRRNKAFSIMSLVSVMASVVLYLTSYPLPVEWLFWWK